MRIELLLFFSLMVMIIVMIACSAPRRLRPPALSPTLFPVLTLTPYNARVIARVGGEVSIAATISPPSANSAALSISSPRCYRTASPMLACLGIVRNAGLKPLRDIMLTVGFGRADGEMAGEHVFGLEQGRIEGNADGAIVGYRAVDIAGDLSIGETRELDLTVNPIRGQAPARHRVALEALTARRP